MMTSTDISGTRLPQIQQANGQGKEIPANIKKTAEKFEAMFVSQMIGHMYEGIEPNEYFGGGQAEEVFRSLLVEEYGKMVAKSGKLGMSQQLQSEILKLQEAK